MDKTILTTILVACMVASLGLGAYYGFQKERYSRTYQRLMQSPEPVLQALAPQFKDMWQPFALYASISFFLAASLGACSLLLVRKLD